METIANIKVGKPDTTPSKTAHTRGVKQGNGTGALEKEAGFYTDGDITKATPRRSTGIGAEHRKPIDDRMPCLSPP